MGTLAVDRNLLFGMLALQNGLIEQGQLVAAFQAWTRDRSRALAEYLGDRGDLEADDRAAVEALVARHLKKHGGSAQRSLAAIAAGRSTRESLASIGDPEIEQTLTQLASDSDGEADRTTSYSVGTATSDGQRFRVLRPHARGGLGAVFVALDAELHREVALKQILDEHADDPCSRARFLIEAEITGSLEHPGIVPVYGLGAHADGRPYYAMRFIRGDSLKEAVNRFHADESLKSHPGRRSLELRKLLRRLTDVCDTMEYAHSRGVLHRDIKPGNVIVGKHGETLVVDWGLAKATGRADPEGVSGERKLVPSSASGSAETLPGSALGTPAYMSPEQAEGNLDRLGPRSDVYSLGATLYFLLTGQPPVAGDVGEVLRAVQRGEFRPPRQLDPMIDRALEAVCVKAMALRPEDRYPSPKAMAEDIERWMADEPVSAWREPWSRSVGRWLARHRVGVAAACAAVLVSLMGTGAVLAVQTRANAELTRANADLGVANDKVTRANADLMVAHDKVTRANADLEAANRRERQRFDLAMEAIKLFHGEVSQDLLLKEKQFAGLRSKLLKGAADFYGKLEGLLEGQSDTSARAALGRAYFELAELTFQIGTTADAAAVQRKALAVRRELAGRPGADAEAVLDVVRSLNALGDALNEGPDRAAVQAHREAVELAEGLAASGRAGDEARFVLAKSLSRKGGTERSGARGGDAGAATTRRSLAILHELVERDPSNAGYLEELGQGHYQIGLILAAELGRPAEAIAEYEESIAVLRKLVDSQPGVHRYRNRLAQIHNNISAALDRLGRGNEAVEARRRAVAIWRAVAEANPAVTSVQNNLAFGLNYLAWKLTAVGRPAEALGPLAEARPILRRLTDADFGHIAHPNNLAYNHIFTGDALRRLGRWREAETEHRAALTLFRRMADENPTNYGCLGNVAWGHANLGLVLKESGRPAEAEAQYRAALAIRRKAVRDRPSALFWRELAITQAGLGLLLRETRRASDAEAEYRAALVILRELVRRNPTMPGYRDDLADGHSDLGDLLRSLGRPAEARDTYDQAIALREALVGEIPAATTYLGRLAHSLRCRGLARGDLGDRAGAAADAGRALELYDGLPSRSDAEWYQTACCHAALAGLAGAAGSGILPGSAPAEADRAMEQLRKAVAMGYRSLGAFRDETALGTLRDRPDFGLLLMDLAMPDEAFACPE
jgi:serine/threonine-protein kinase